MNIKATGRVFMVNKTEDYEAIVFHFDSEPASQKPKNKRTLYNGDFGVQLTKEDPLYGTLIPGTEIEIIIKEKTNATKVQKGKA